MKKHFSKLILLITTLLITSYGFTTIANASADTTNRKADSAYKKEIRNFQKFVKSTWYKFTDITGDGIHEAIVFGKTIGGSGNIWKIYTYKNGKVVNILDSSEYGLDKMVVYKKTKSFYYHRAGHGSENYVFMQLKNGKYQLVAVKGRPQDGTVKWSYSHGNNEEISRNEYNKIIKKLKQGKAIKMNPLKWKKTKS